MSLTELAISSFFSMLTVCLPFVVRAAVKLFSEKTKIAISESQEQFLQSKAQEAIRYAEEQSHKLAGLGPDSKRSVARGYLQAEANALKAPLTPERADRLLESNIGALRPSLPSSGAAQPSIPPSRGSYRP